MIGIYCERSPFSVRLVEPYVHILDEPYDEA